MLHILLLILKIIGIILGILLGVLLICCCLALFVPVRYQLEAKRKQEEGSPPVEMQVKITWLLHLVNIRLHYATKLQLRARIFLFTVFSLPQKQKAKKKKRRRKGSEKSSKAAKEKKDIQKEIKNDDLEKEHVEEPVKEEQHAKEPIREEQHAKEPIREEQPTKEPIREERHVKESIKEGQHVKENRIEEDGIKDQNNNTDENSGKVKKKFSFKELVAKICRFFQNIWYTIIGICDKIKKIRENIEYYLDVLQSDAFLKSYALCKKELGRILSYIKPRKVQADLMIGMGDPAATAKILSYYGMLYPIIGGNVNIVPDFDEKRIEGNVLIKGKLKLFTFLRAAFHIYFSKDIKRLLKLFKKEDV